MDTTRRGTFILAGLGLANLFLVQTASAAPSAAEPYDLSIIEPVQVAGSDAAAAAFQTNVLPGMLTTVQLDRPLVPCPAGNRGLT